MEGVKNGMVKAWLVLNGFAGGCAVEARVSEVSFVLDLWGTIGGTVS